MEISGPQKTSLVQHRFMQGNDGVGPKKNYLRVSILDLELLGKVRKYYSGVVGS